MKGLLLKELYGLRQYLKQYLLMLLFFMIFAFMMKSPVYIVFMGLVMGSNLMFSGFITDEAGGFAFSRILPLSRKNIVQGKYIMFLVGWGAVVCVTVILGSIVGVLNDISFVEWLPAALLGGVFYIVSLGIVIPIALKWKSEKARIALLGALAIPCVLVMIVSQYTDKLQLFFQENGIRKDLLLQLSVAGIPLALIVLIASYVISVRVFEKREF